MSRRLLSTIPSILNGKHVFSNQKIPVYSHNSEIIHYYLPIEDIRNVGSICEDAYAGFLAWSSRPYQERREILNAAADSIEKDKELFIEAHMEIGSSETFARICADNSIAGIREYASIVSRPDGIMIKSTADLALTFRTPIGPVLSIAPWNAPTVLWSRAIVAPLAAGCSVVLKSSEKAPKLPYMYTEHLLRAGVDAKALQLVHVAPDDHSVVTESFLANDLIRKVNFTGSTLVGTHIAELAAKYLKPTLLELGGKNVSIICADADLDKAAMSTILSAWIHKGQVCMCLDNVYVESTIYSDFVTKLVKVAQDFAQSPDMLLGQRDVHGASKVSRLVSDALDKGAQIIYGEPPSSSSSTSFSPMILTGITSDMQINSEEIFGPVCSVFEYEDVDQVIAQVSRSRYGLKASIWSANVMHALSLAKRMDFGGIHINGSTVHDESTVPHGGVKLSGMGRFNSMWGVEEFSYTKAVTIQE